jgi:hypothetical protein
MSDLIKPFQLNVSEGELSELRERLHRVPRHSVDAGIWLFRQTR